MSPFKSMFDALQMQIYGYSAGLFALGYFCGRTQPIRYSWECYAKNRVRMMERRRGNTSTDVKK